MTASCFKQFPLRGRGCVCGWSKFFEVGAVSNCIQTVIFQTQFHLLYNQVSFEEYSGLFTTWVFSICPQVKCDRENLTHSPQKKKSRGWWGGTLDPCFQFISCYFCSLCFAGGKSWWL